MYIKVLGTLSSAVSLIMYKSSIVYGVFSVDTASTIMNVSDSFHWFAKGFTDILALDNVQLSPADTPLMGALIAATVQTFYAYRIFKIDRRAWPVSVLVTLVG